MLRWYFRSFAPCRLTVFIVLLAVIATLTPSAYSRDEFRRVYPDEITVDALERYGKWLNLSESQLVSARAMHKAYLEKFATLKAEVIDPHGPPEWMAENSFAEHSINLSTIRILVMF